MSSIDNIFKESLSGVETSAPSQVWSQIEGKLPNNTSISTTETIKGTPSLFSTVMSTSVLVIGITTFSFLVVQNSSDTIKNNIQTFTETSPNKEKEQKSISIDNQVQTVTAIATKKINTKNDTHSSSNQSTKKIEKIILSDEPVLERKTVPTPQVVSSKKEGISDIETVEKAQKTEKVHRKGEYVTFTIKFNNTSGKKVKSLKVWEEFPDWCDASTLETISHNSMHEVHTSIKEGQNTVEWKIKGVFSPDKLNPSNTGYIEYRVKLAEDRKASELAKNQPGVK